MSAATDRARGFPAFPPTRRRGGPAAGTWWGRAWVAAVEGTLLDRNLLTRGRRYAYAGQVGSITASPGRLAAPVHDGDPDAPHQTLVRVEQLTSAEWDWFAAQAAGAAGHLAALLERELPRELVRAAADAGVQLLPAAGDLVPECSCPNGELACVHAAALGYQAGWLLEADPLLLVLLRGCGERELLAAVQQRTIPAGTGAGPAGPGTPAEQAYTQPVPPLPPPLPLPEPVGELDPPVADAAARARRLLGEHRGGQFAV